VRGYIPMRLVKWEDIKVRSNLAGEFPMKAMPGTEGVLLVYSTSEAAQAAYPDAKIVELAWGGEG